MGLLFIPVWKEAPFIRLVLPFTVGIIIQHYLHLPSFALWAAIVFSFACGSFMGLASLDARFLHYWIQGLWVNVLLSAIGALLFLYHDTSARAQTAMWWSSDSALIIACLQEPLVVKPRSFKALCTISSIQTPDTCIAPATNVIVYFRKDSLVQPPSYGERIAFQKRPERIRNMPGSTGFDYVQYCALKNIYFQVFLNAGDYIRLPHPASTRLGRLLFAVQNWVIAVLRLNIPGRKECGLAEALLIGFKDDLDKNLIQSYSRTGVVHVVAISGLHLGLVYAILRWLCRPLARGFAGRWSSLIITISGLWLFSLLAGGSPSVLRSAVMFSFIVAGEGINRKTSVYNNLAASALFLLAYEPLWLWDIGFQLSYAALTSILVFMKPLYRCRTFKNRLVDTIWKLNAVTLAAQVLTLPLCIYYFHQFPTFFLLTNFIAVPVSSAILVGEIMLCAISPVPAVAGAFGWLLSLLLKWMNAVVEALGSLPLSVIDQLNITLGQAVLMYFFIVCVAVWLLMERRLAVPAALVAAILFMVVRFI